MSYTKLIFQDNPLVIWSLDDIKDGAIRSASSRSINFKSASAHTASIVIATTSVYNQPIVYGSKYAIDIETSGSALAIPALDIFSERLKNREYALEFWLKLENISSTERKIFGRRNSNTNGLFISYNNIIFRCGDSDKYIETYQNISSVEEPIHVVVQYNSKSIDLILNGQLSSTVIDTPIFETIDTNHDINNYIDFYGDGTYDNIVDCIAIYSKKLNKPKALRHYMYGVAHTVQEQTFSSRGGDFHNLSLSTTRPAYQRTLTTYDDFNFISSVEYENIHHDNYGMKVYRYDPPTLFSIDDGITKLSADNILFSSSQNTKGSFIDIPESYLLVNDRTGIKPIFVKVNLCGQVPNKQESQSIFSISKNINQDLIRFDLYNDSTSQSANSYKIVVRSDEITDEVQFNISNISSSPNIWLGVDFTDKTILYFGDSTTGSVTTGSYNSASVDPLILYNNRIPQSGNIRIGSRYNYTDSDTLSTIGNTYQFYGKFIQFFVANEKSASSFNSVSSIESSGASAKYYNATWSYAKNNFNIASYGKATFNLPCYNFLGTLKDDVYSISANRIELFYPYIQSNSEVDVYISGYQYVDYEDPELDTVFQQRTSIRSENSFKWINNKNLTDKYLKFEIEMSPRNDVDYPPVFSGMKVSTYAMDLSNSASYMALGEKIRLYGDTQNQIFLPESNKTPTSFMKNDSGIRLNQNKFDILFNSVPVNFNPEIIDGLSLWLDARFTNGFNGNYRQDNDPIDVWTDLSTKNNNATQTTASSRPKYRSQSLNLFTINESSGAESGSVTLFTASGATASSTNNFSSHGLRSIVITPTGTVPYSYIQTSSIGGIGSNMFAGETYTAVGTIIINNPQLSQSSSARKIIAFVKDGASYTRYDSAQASNSASSYSLSVTFTTGSAATDAFIRYYNGASATNELVYWDDLGIYSGSSISGSAIVWRPPVDIEQDVVTVKFDGTDDYLRVPTASVEGPMTVYVVGRSFSTLNPFLGGVTDIAKHPTIYNASGGYFAANGASNILFGQNNKKFNLITTIFNGASSSIYLNGSVSITGNLGTRSIDNNELLIGAGLMQLTGASATLKGDISSVLIYSGSHTAANRQFVESWLKETWGIE